MTRANPANRKFTRGELHPDVLYREDLQAYDAGAIIQHNFISLPWGGVARRTGRRHIAANKLDDKPARPLEFVFNTDAVTPGGAPQAYIIEAGEHYLRFYTDGGQIVVLPTDAAIVNGDFSNNLTGWDDRSTGGASIQHDSQAAKIDLIQFAQTQVHGWGDAVANGQHFGLRFQALGSGTINEVAVQLQNVVTPFTARATIYNDNSGSPGTQVGGDSDDVTSLVIGRNTFVFSATPPAVTQGVNYWLVFSDVSGTGGNAIMSCCADQGSPYMTGRSDVITNIADASGGIGGAIDLRAEVQILPAAPEGAMLLVGAAAGEAAGEQAVTTTALDQEHVVAFTVGGAPGEFVQVRVGATTDGDQFQTDQDAFVGVNTVAFTPTSSPFYLQFRNKADKTLRIDDVTVLASGAGQPVPLELPSPWAAENLAAIKYAQEADVMYMVSGDAAAVQKLSRRGAADWSLVPAAFIDGPYLEENGDPDKTLQPNNTTDGIVTAAGHAPFVASDVDRLLRLKQADTWGAARIVEVLAPEQVRVKSLDGLDFADTSATAAWRLGLFSPSTGYPQAVTFFEQRLFLGGTRARPSRVDGSRGLGEVEDFTPGNQAADAVAYNIKSKRINRIRWLEGLQALLPGTSDSEFRLSGSTSQAALTPTDILAKPQTGEGSANIRALDVSNVILFVQAEQQQIHELAFSFEVGTDGGFVAPEISILSRHMLEAGIRDWCYQQTPWSVVWIALNDGRLVAMTYEREQAVIAFHQHPLPEGYFVEGVASIPGAGEHELWLTVRRERGGTVTRSMEKLCYTLKREDPQENGFFVDSGLSLDNTIDASLTPGATTGSNVTFTSSPGVFGAGDVGRVIKYRWSRRDAKQKLIYKTSRATITEFTSATEVKATIEVDFPSTDAIPAAAWRLTVTSVSGLDHLEGDTVAVVGDGAVQASQVVSGGAITLEVPAATVHVGLAYTSILQPTRPIAGAQRGTARDKKKRIAEVSLVLDRSGPTKIGRDLDILEQVFMREVADAMDTAVPLGSQLYRLTFPGEVDREADVYVVQDLPLPCNVLAIYPSLEVNEG